MTLAPPFPDQGLPWPELPTPSIASKLLDLTDCVCAQLEINGAGRTCWCGLYPGASASWDYCGECGGDICGMGYVRLAGIFPYETFPVQVLDDRCVKPLAWAIEVGALRCFPTSEDGELISPQAMAEVSIRQVLDANALYVAMKCCELELAVGGYIPVGPAGGCVGGYWNGFVAAT
jgi:hypothetical protein